MLLDSEQQIQAIRRLIASGMSENTAEPPISPDEARFADTHDPAICRFHNGLIADGRAAEDVLGRVYFCPVGRMYWRLTPLMSDFLRPLRR